MVNSGFGEDNPLPGALDLLDAGEAEAAAAVLKALVEAGRGGLAARLALARALMATSEIDTALTLARDTASLYPDVAEAALGLGAVLLAGEHLPEAIAALQQALRTDPENGDARYLLGSAWLEAGEPEPALAAFAALADMPGLAEAVAEAEAMAKRPRSDAGYVRHLFDQFSADYDTRMLGALSYRAPAILTALADLVIPGANDLCILDLGCGTGLSGAAFKPRAARLTGIDLSPAMIEKARARGLYDALAVGDIESGLGHDLFDLAIAADTLVYLGDLEASFAAVAAALKPGGHFLFTVEAKGGGGFELGPKRRWRHSTDYLTSLAAAHGLVVAGLLDCVPRHEAQTPVNGYAVALAKPM